MKELEKNRLIKVIEDVRAEAIMQIGVPTYMKLRNPDGTYKHRRWFRVVGKEIHWSDSPDAAGKSRVITGVTEASLAANPLGMTIHTAGNPDGKAVGVVADDALDRQ
eukprot:COSAG02_NODE_50479_length_320_cov_0.705882_1_plen_106_part_11